jgi:hypothetical protein
LLGYQLQEEVLAEVPHLQWVFTIPKRLRVYFRYDNIGKSGRCNADPKYVCKNGPVLPYS